MDERALRRALADASAPPIALLTIEEAEVQVIELLELAASSFDELGRIGPLSAPAEVTAAKEKVGSNCGLMSDTIGSIKLKCASVLTDLQEHLPLQRSCYELRDKYHALQTAMQAIDAFLAERT